MKIREYCNRNTPNPPRAHFSSISVDIKSLFAVHLDVCMCVVVGGWGVGRSNIRFFFFFFFLFIQKRFRVTPWSSGVYM